VEIIIAAGLGALATIIVALIGLYGARKAGIGTTQDRLIVNLQGLVQSQEKRIGVLVSEATDRDRRIDTLEQQVAGLKDLTISQALTIKKLSAGRRRDTHVGG
jgi:hypothetical protein